MSTVDGTWEVRATGLGMDATARVNLRSVGAEVSGEVIDGADRFPVTGGRLEGDRLTFDMTVTEPMRAKISATLTVDGDRMTGTARAKVVLKVNLEAHRVAR